MANRFPLVLDTTDNNKIKEIQTGDNLNLADNSIVGVQNITALGTIDAADIKVNGNRLVAQAFNDLTDTPSTFVGSPNYFVKVKADGTGLEYRPLSDLGNIEIDTITVDTSIVPSTTNVGNVGTEAKKFNEIVATTLKGNLVSYNEEIVFDATTGKVSYAALQGAPTFLSEFTDDVGYLQTTDLDTTLAGLFDDGVPFTTDIVGSVFGDDSTILVDGVNGIITGDVLNSQITTTDLITTTARITTTTATTINGPAAGNLTIDAGTSGIINIGTGVSTTTVNIENAVIETFDQGSGLGVAQITASTDLEITAGNRVRIEGGIPFRFASTTTALQLAIGAQEGDVIYNTTSSRLQMYQGGAWKDVNGNVEATTGTSNFNDVTIAGNLIVQGTTTSIETTNTTITDNVITLNQGEVGAGVTAGTSGIEVDRGSEANKTLVWDDSIDKWTVGSETFVAGTVEAVGLQSNFLGNGGQNSPLQLSSGLEGQTGNTIFINPQGSDTLVQMWGETINLVTGPFNTYDSPYMQFKTEGAFKAHQGAYFDGNLTGDVTGSVFGDDSTILVDGVAGKIVGDIDNAEVLTTTVQGRASANLNIYRGAGGTVSLGDASSGDVSVSDSGINITSTAGVDIDGAATGTVNIGTGATTGNVTIGKVGNTTTINGTLNAALTGNVNGNITGDVAGNVTGNIDNTILTIGAASATSIAIGNPGSTTTIDGNFELTDALIVNNITADDSISITTAAGDGNAISIGPGGTNTFVNLTADQIRFFGPITRNIEAQAGVTGDLKGSVVADDSTVMIDGQSGTIVGPIVSANISGTLVKATTIENHTTDDLAINVDGFININAGTDDSGLSKIQMDQAGINYIELTTQPIAPGNPADVANIAINATAASGDVVIGTTGSTRNQVVTIHNATVNGTLVGSAQGNHTGTLTGDVVGSVFADDSAPMVDALNYAMFSDTLSLTPLNTEPSNPTNGMIAVADGTGWDPASNAKNTLVAYLGDAWVTVAAAA
jgi:hypothetical protein